MPNFKQHTTYVRGPPACHQTVVNPFTRVAHVMSNGHSGLCCKAQSLCVTLQLGVAMRLRRGSNAHTPDTDGHRHCKHQHHDHTKMFSEVCMSVFLVSIRGELSMLKNKIAAPTHPGLTG